MKHLLSLESLNQQGQSLLEAVGAMSIMMLFVSFLFAVLFLGSAKSISDLLLHEALICADIERNSARCQQQVQRDLQSKLLFLAHPKVQIQDQGFQWHGKVEFQIPWAWNQHIRFEQNLPKDF
jgi:hypothetical protein